jgi:hypothetical protein
MSVFVCPQDKKKERVYKCLVLGREKNCKCKRRMVEKFVYYGGI